MSSQYEQQRRRTTDLQFTYENSQFERKQSNLRQQKINLTIHITYNNLGFKQHQSCPGSNFINERLRHF